MVSPDEDSYKGWAVHTSVVPAYVDSPLFFGQNTQKMVIKVVRSSMKIL